MSNLPSINQFLEEIDSNKTIDRKQAMADITSVVLMKALAAIHTELAQNDQDKVKKFAESRDEDSFDKIYEVLKKAGKKEDFIEVINENICAVRVDYMKTHLEAMTEEKRNKVLSKFPGLKDLK